MQDSNLSSTRMWIIAIVISVAITVALGIGFAVGSIQEEQFCIDKSPLYNKPSASREGHYSHATAAMESLLANQMSSTKMQLKRASTMDTVISAMLTSGVMNPHSSGIGGGHFITFYKKATQEVHTVVGREQAPSAATVDMFKEDETLSKIGGKAIGVPGEVLGMYNAWKLGGGGIMEWKDLFKPAVLLCRYGFYVGPAFLEAIDEMKKHNFYEDSVPGLKKFLTNPATGEIYKDGDKMFRPKLANTLKMIAHGGPYAFYNGSLAENITLDIAEAGGNITLDDLDSYTAPVKPAEILHLRNNMAVHSPPLPSGGVLYQYILNILNGYKMNATCVSTVDKAQKTYHRIIESFKHAFSRRAELGDIGVATDAIKLAINQLATNMTDLNFGELTRALINDTKTYDNIHYSPNYAVNWDKGGSHFSVVGPNGDAVAVTSTVSSWFGSKVIGNRTGILFNNVMGAFNTQRESSHAETYTANTIAPGKRPMSSMSPSIVLDGHGNAKLVVGASGGPKTITAAALTTMNNLWFDWGIKKAVDYPRIHHQMFPEGLQVEHGFPQVLIDGLQHMGHKITMYHPSTTSQVQGIARIGSLHLSSISDYRGHGEAQGYEHLYH